MSMNVCKDENFKIQQKATKERDKKTVTYRNISQVQNVFSELSKGGVFVDQTIQDQHLEVRRQFVKQRKVGIGKGLSDALQR